MNQVGVAAASDLRGDVAVLVPAAGSGVRLGAGPPKALRSLAGEPILLHAVRRVLAAACVRLVVVAAPPAELDTVRDLLAGLGPVTVVAGGASRQESVALALAAVPPDIEIILVHDAARALAPPSLVDDVARAVRGGRDAVVPALPVPDTIKSVRDGVVTGTLDRDRLVAVQTPQGFRRAILATAHAGAVDRHTDDAGMVERLGVTVHTVPGDPYAMKITNRHDLAAGEALLARDGADRPG